MSKIIHAAWTRSGPGRFSPLCERKNVKRSNVVPGAAFSGEKICRECLKVHRRIMGDAARRERAHFEMWGRE